MSEPTFLYPFANQSIDCFSIALHLQPDETDVVKRAIHLWTPRDDCLEEMQRFFEIVWDAVQAFFTDSLSIRAHARSLIERKICPFLLSIRLAMEALAKDNIVSAETIASMQWVFDSEIFVPLLLYAWRLTNEAKTPFQTTIPHINPIPTDFSSPLPTETVVDFLEQFSAVFHHFGSVLRMEKKNLLSGAV